MVVGVLLVGGGWRGAVVAEANGIKFRFTGTSLNRQQSEDQLGRSWLLRLPVNMSLTSCFYLNSQPPQISGSTPHHDTLPGKI